MASAGKWPASSNFKRCADFPGENVKPVEGFDLRAAIQEVNYIFIDFNYFCFDVKRDLALFYRLFILIFDMHIKHLHQRPWIY